MKTCPYCKAQITDKAGCYRCGFDFNSLINCQLQSKILYHQALQKYHCGDLKSAQQLVGTASFFCKNKINSKLQLMIQLKRLYYE
jgi:hypothetical protein